MAVADKIGPHNVVQCANNLLQFDISLGQAKHDKKLVLDITRLEQLLKDYQHTPWKRAYPGMTVHETNDYLLDGLIQQTKHCVCQLASRG